MDGAPDGSATLTVRPEAIKLGPAENAVQAVVTSLQFLGTQTEMRVQVGAIPLVVLVQPDQAEEYGVGDIVMINLPRQAVWLLPPEGARRD